MGAAGGGVGGLNPRWPAPPHICANSPDINGLGAEWRTFFRDGGLAWEGVTLACVAIIGHINICNVYNKSLETGWPITDAIWQRRFVNRRRETRDRRLPAPLALFSIPAGAPFLPTLSRALLAGELIAGFPG